MLIINQSFIFILHSIVDVDNQPAAKPLPPAPHDREHPQLRALVLSKTASPAGACSTDDATYPHTVA